MGLGPLLLLVGLMFLAVAACGEPVVTGEATPPPSMSADFRSLEVGPNERFAMASGLSVVLPDSVPGTVAYGDDRADMFTELLLAEPEALPRWEGVALLSLEKEVREMPQLARFEQTAEVVAEGRHVKVLWGRWKDERWLMIVTRLPERLTGVLWHQLSSASDTGEARSEARNLWRQFSVQGASLPLK